MFTKEHYELPSIATCNVALDTLPPAQEFYYFDKDGFEINLAEIKYYKAMGYGSHLNPVLNHICWQDPWLTLQPEYQDKFLMDHCMLLVKTDFTGDAREQIKEASKTIPYAQVLLQAKAKWGYDIALDSIDDNGNIFEVLHIEVDDYDFPRFSKKLAEVEEQILNTDWDKAAKQIIEAKPEWEKLSGYAQNDWKAQNILGWSAAEYTEKAVA